MRIKSKSELIVKSFVQRVSSSTSFGKRYKNVCRLLDSRPQLTEDQWLRVWRGMYYSVWYSEMTRGCDVLIDRIGGHEDVAMALTGFKALTNDWFGIDVFRLDKYMLLVRVLANNCLKMQFNCLANDISIESCLKSIECEDNHKNSSEEDVKEVEENVNKTNDKQKKSSKRQRNKRFDKSKANLKKEIVFDIEMKAKIIDNVLTTVKPSIGLTLHLTDIFIDELVKVLTQLRPKAQQRIGLYFDILVPFIKLMAVSEDYRVLNNVKHNIFDKFKNELLISESVETRKQVLRTLVDAMVSIGSVETIGRKNRDSIYNLIETFETKVNQLNKSDDNKGVKRKRIVMGRGRHKRVKYELTSSSPFVTSIVPIAVI